MRMTIEVIKNDKGVYLLYLGSSILNYLKELQILEATIVGHPCYKVLEQFQILEIVQADYSNLSEVYRKELSIKKNTNPKGILRMNLFFRCLILGEVSL